MNILVAPDSFKETLSSDLVARAIAKGLSANHKIMECPLADGGEGTLEILFAHFGGQKISMMTRNAVGQEIKAEYGYIASSVTAIIELAQASGLEQIQKEDRDILRASSFGTGLLIRDAIDRGAENIILTLGGSAINDAGAGIMAALGVQFLGEDDEPFIPAGHDLGDVKRLDFSQSVLTQCSFTIACDVTNPIIGEKGASKIFAPQKGATPEDIMLLESQMTAFVSMVEELSSKGLKDIPGLGAAGGSALLFYAFAEAELISGIDLVARSVGLEEKVRSADLIITGEGQYDRQSNEGKVVSKLKFLCEKHEKQCTIICGRTELKEVNVYALVDYFEEKDCMKKTAACLTKLSSQLFQ